MDDAAQKLVDEAREYARGGNLPAGAHAYILALIDALEAAQRPPVSEEYTHVVNLARASEAADKGLDALIDYLADLPTVEEWRPPVSPEQREALIDLLTPFGRPLVEWPDRLADAILARFSLPPVSPEQREAIRAVVGEQLTRAGLDLDGPPFTDDGEAQWPVALELRDRMTDAILARFSLPVLDVEEVARVIQVAANRSEDRSPGQTRAEWYAAALVAAIQSGELSAPARHDLPARSIDDETG